MSKTLFEELIAKKLFLRNPEWNDISDFELLQLHRQGIEILEGLSVFDPAFDHFNKSEKSMRKELLSRHLNTTKDAKQLKLALVIVNKTGNKQFYELAEILDVYQCGWMHWQRYARCPYTMVVVDLRNKDLSDPQILEMYEFICQLYGFGKYRKPSLFVESEWFVVYADSFFNERVF